MKNFVIPAFILIIFFLLCACSDDDENVNSVNLANIKGTYQGVMDVSIDYYDMDMYGALTFIENKKYQFQASAIIGDPKKEGSITETNPFFLFISPDDVAGAEGELSIISAMNLVVGDGNVLLQFWDFDYNGGAISGELVHNGIDESVAVSNSFMTWEDAYGVKIVTLSVMSENKTTFQGNIDNKNITLEISGESTNTTRKFTATFSGEK